MATDQLISEKGIYINESQNDDFPKIHTLSDLRQAVEYSINENRRLNLHYDDLGIGNIGESKVEFLQKTGDDIEKARDGSLEDIKQLLKEYKIEVVNISPHDLKEDWYLDDKSPVLVNIDYLRATPEIEIGGREMATENERGIYLYPTMMNEESFGGQRNINTLDDLKREVLVDINDYRYTNYPGWSNEKYDKIVDQVQRGSLDDVLEYMKENRMLFSTQPPITIATGYFDKIEGKRLWIEPHELKVSGEKIEFSRAELPLNVERQIDVSLGTVQGVMEREQDRGHFAVVKDRFGEGYSMVRVDNKPEGHQLNVKRGFPTLEAAENQMENQLSRESLKPNKEMEKTPSMEVSR